MGETLSPVLLGRFLLNFEGKFLSTKANAETYYSRDSGSQAASQHFTDKTDVQWLNSTLA